MSVPLFEPPLLKGLYIDRVLQSGWYTAGPMGDRLREKLGEMFEWDPVNIVLCSSATAAFQAILDLYIARAKVATVGISRATWPGMLYAIEMSRLARVTLEGKLGCINVLTHLGGADALEPVEKPDVIDACHSWWILKDAADFQITSFYPTKLAPGAEGGVIFCRKEEDAEDLVLKITCGLGYRHKKVGTWTGIGCTPGRKAVMTDVQAALNLEALDYMPKNIERVSEVWHYYEKYFKKLDILVWQQIRRPYLLQILMAYGNVQKLRHKLYIKNIETAWNFPPAPLVTLPTWGGLGEFTVQKICEITHDAIKEIDHESRGRKNIKDSKKYSYFTGKEMEDRSDSGTE